MEVRISFVSQTPPSDHHEQQQQLPNECFGLAPDAAKKLLEHARANKKTNLLKRIRKICSLVIHSHSEEWLSEVLQHLENCRDTFALTAHLNYSNDKQIVDFYFESKEERQTVLDMMQQCFFEYMNGITNDNSGVHPASGVGGVPRYEVTNLEFTNRKIRFVVQVK